MSTDPTPRPARGYSRPPFEPGNMAAVKHGATSPRIVAAKAEEIRTDLVASAPWVADPLFADAVVRYCEARAVEALLNAHIFRLAEEGQLASMRAFEQRTAASRHAHAIGADLGLTPSGYAKLRSVAADAAKGEVTLAEMIDRGRSTEGYKRRVETTQAPTLDAGSEDES